MNLFRAVHTRAALRPDSGYHFLGADGAEDTVVPYQRFLRMSAWLGQKIPHESENRTVVIVATTPMATLLAFFAALAENCRPLIMPGPGAVSSEELVRRVTQVVARFDGGCVLALEDDAVPDAVRLPDVPVVPLSASAAEYGEVSPALPTTAGDDIAFLQMTSASTGDAKIIPVTHANACANLTAMGDSLGLTEGDRMVSWLPLHHDMGLVGAVLLSAYWGHPLHLMKPREFIRRPKVWLQTISSVRATFTASPNFGYDHVRRSVRDADLAGLDLSCLTRAVIGAEPIRLVTMKGFYERFRSTGLRPGSLVCAYGMAESVLAASMVRGGAAPRYLYVDPGHTVVGEPVRLLGEGFIGEDPAGRDESRAPERGVPVFSSGPALRGTRLSIVDDDGKPVDGAGILGEIVLGGPSVFPGYYDPATGPEPLDGDFHTGDLGFLHRGELFIVERRKHVVIRNGRNYLASLLEERVARVLGHPVHEIMVLDADIHDPESDIVAVVENASRTADVDESARRALRELDLPVDVVAFAVARIIPRTTSGKKKYDRTRRGLAEHSLPFTHVVRLTG